MPNFNNNDNILYISSYSDKQALDDGTLINIAPLNIYFQGVPINRITSNLYYRLDSFLISHSIVDRLLELKKILASKLHMAFYKGDIWQLPPNLWLIENEVDGWTLMLPDDY